MIDPWCPCGIQHPGTPLLHPPGHPENSTSFLYDRKGCRGHLSGRVKPAWIGKELRKLEKTRKVKKVQKMASLEAKRPTFLILRSKSEKT